VTITDEAAPRVVLEHVTHAAAQTAVDVQTTSIDDRVLRVTVVGQVARYALAQTVIEHPVIRAVFRETDGSLTEELTGASRLRPGFTVLLTGPHTPLQ